MLQTRPPPRLGLLNDAFSRMLSPFSSSPSPLLTLPPELLELIALHLATLPPNLGPPAALLPLLSVCRAIYLRLGWGKNWAFWAKIGGAKFTRLAGAGHMPYDGYPCEVPDAFPGGGIGIRNEDGRSSSKLHRAAQALRARCVALSIIRRGDPHALGAARALKVAYGMLVEDDWDAAEMDWTALNAVLGRAAPRPESIRAEEVRGKGKNRRQLAWANAREFAMKYVLERLYEGRFGERDPPWAQRPSSSSTLDLRARYRAEALAEFHQHPEWAQPAWRVGWPRDAEGAAAAMWVVWFFEDEDTLRAEPESLRRHLMGLLLPMVVAPFRYPSALAPSHHYSVPLLPAVYTSDAFDSETRAITIPTNHGSYPLYPLGAPLAPVPSSSHRRPQRARTRTTSRLLSAPPARLLFFDRMQVCARMGVPPVLPRDRAEAVALFRASGAPGPPPIRPTQQDILEKNARPLVRFERQLPSYGASSIASSGSATTPTPAAAIDAMCAVDPELDVDVDTTLGERDERWAAHRWRGELCHGYGHSAPATSVDVDERAMATSEGSSSPSPHGVQIGGTGSGKGGAPPGRIGRVYPLGAFEGLWAGTMLMPSEHQYAAVVAAPGGALPPGGLAGDDFPTAARPVYMRIKELWSFHPHRPAPAPPPNSTTADEGLLTGWLPAGTRVLGVGGGAVEVRVPDSAAAAAGDDGMRRGEERVYTYHTPLDARAPPAEHPAHDRERCPGCVRGRERARAAKEQQSETASNGGSGPESWPEWDAPAWAAHPFDSDRDGQEGWEDACDGVQDVVFAGETDPEHGMAWHHYEYAGRVRPWDGLIGIVMRPRDRTAGLHTFFISGHLVGRDTFEGTWQMATQDVLAPSWGGSICLARGEE